MLDREFHLKLVDTDTDEMAALWHASISFLKFYCEYPESILIFYFFIPVGSMCLKGLVLRVSLAILHL